MEKKYRNLIESCFRGFFDQKIKTASCLELKRVIQKIAQFALRNGKRIRPLLFVYSYRCFKNKVPQRIFETAVSFELIHNGFLIQDDVMDNDFLRRGFPTFHAYWRDKLSSLKTGENLGVLGGDILINYGIENFLEKTRNKDSVQYFLETINKVNYGQILDTLFPSLKTKKMTEDDIFLLYRFKTASYTFVLPLVLGAKEACASWPEVKKMAKVGLLLGVSYQVQDDLLGILGEEKTIGKPVASDIEEGKITWIYYLAFQNASLPEKQFLQKVLKTKISPKDLKKIQNILYSTGAIASAEHFVEENIEKARKTIRKSSFLPNGKNFLLKIISKIEKRKY